MNKKKSLSILGLCLVMMLGCGCSKTATGGGRQTTMADYESTAKSAVSDVVKERNDIDDDEIIFIETKLVRVVIPNSRYEYIVRCFYRLNGKYYEATFRVEVDKDGHWWLDTIKAV